MIQELQIALLEYIRIFIFVEAGGQPECIDAEEGTELLFKQCLFDIGSRAGWYPQLLRIIRNLKVNEAHRAYG